MEKSCPCIIGSLISSRGTADALNYAFMHIMETVNSTRFAVIVYRQTKTARIDKRYKPARIMIMSECGELSVYIERNTTVGVELFNILSTIANRTYRVSMIDYIPNSGSITWFE